MAKEKFDKDSKGRDRLDRLLHFFGGKGGILQITTRTQMRKKLAEINKAAKDREKNKRRIDNEVIKIQRKSSKENSNKLAVKNDGQTDGDGCASSRPE